MISIVPATRGPALALLVFAVASCAGGARPAPETGASGAQAPGAAAPRAARRSQSVITEDEIAENPGVSNVLDLVTRIRPNFLRGTADIYGSASVAVRVDDNPRSVADLRNIQVGEVREIRYYSPQEANLRFAIDTNVPVIAVTLKRLK